jgi:hypothetical protein
VHFKLTVSRIVHAKGAGAYGVFETTHDISNYTSLAFLNQVGKTTPLFSRFSTVAGEKGSADNVRDARGFAFKFYTEEGNLDWLFFGAVGRPLSVSENATLTILLLADVSNQGSCKIPISRPRAKARPLE